MDPTRNFFDRSKILDLMSLSKNESSTVECDISTFVKSFGDVQLLKSKSKSDTIHFIATAQDGDKVLAEFMKNRDAKKVFVKIAPLVAEPTLAYERMMYRFMGNLLDKHITPNVARHLLSYKCTGWSRSAMKSDIESELLKKSGLDKSVAGLWETGRGYLIRDRYDNSATKMEADDGKKQGLGVLITDVINGDHIYNELLKNQKMTQTDFMEVMFQILYTLQQFSYLGIRHNDLHPANILIEPYSGGKMFVYFADSKNYFAFFPKYIAKIFDFDYSTFTREGWQNIIVRKCDEFGICSTPNDKYDIFTIVSSLHDIATSLPENRYVDAINQLLKAVVPDQELFKTIGQIVKSRKGPYYDYANWLDDTIPDLPASTKVCCPTYTGRLCKLELETKKGRTQRVCRDWPMSSAHIRNFQDVIEETDIFNYMRNIPLPEDQLPFIKSMANVYHSVLMTDQTTIEKILSAKTVKKMVKPEYVFDPYASYPPVQTSDSEEEGSDEEDDDVDEEEEYEDFDE